MINLKSKIKTQGWRWFILRVLREILQPVTIFGKYLKPLRFPIYLFICKPINKINYQRTKSKSESTLYFFYDLEVEPITYNFCWALAIAEAKRKEHQLSQLKIIIVPGQSEGLRKEDPTYQSIINDDARWWRIYSILMPMAMLLPSRPSLHFCASRQEALLMATNEVRYLYPDKYNVTFPTTHQTKDGMKYKSNFMSFQATPKARAYIAQWLTQHAHHRKPIVITLREYDYMPERNSNIAAWAAFANKLDKEKFFVVIIPDTEKAFSDLPKPLQGLVSCNEACWNVALRAALYELAYLNLGVNTGPMSLCWLNPACRYITFKITTVTASPSPATIENMIALGFQPNKAPVFANKFQRWIWEEDEENVIYREFNAMIELIENKNIQEAPQLATTSAA